MGDVLVSLHALAAAQGEDNIWRVAQRAAEEIERLRNSYRCYSCKQVFAEDHGHGLAREHFGSHLKGDIPKCTEILNGTATWGGGPHDPFYRVRKEHYDAMEKENDSLRSAITALLKDANQLVMLCAVGEAKAATDLTSRFAKARAVLAEKVL